MSTVKITDRIQSFQKLPDRIWKKLTDRIQKNNKE